MLFSHAFVLALLYILAHTYPRTPLLTPPLSSFASNFARLRRNRVTGNAAIRERQKHDSVQRRPQTEANAIPHDFATTRDATNGTATYTASRLYTGQVRQPPRFPYKQPRSSYTNPAAGLHARTKFATATTGANTYRLHAENIVTPAKHGADHSRSSAMHGTNPTARRHHDANQATQLFSQLRHMRHRSISRNESDAGTSGSHPHPHDRRAQAHLLTLGRNPQSTSRAHRRRVYLRTQTSTHAFIPVAV